MTKRNRWLAAAAVVVVALWALGKLPVIYADYLWFDSLSYGDVFMTRLWTQAALAIGVFLVTAAWLGFNVYVAAKLSPGRVIQIQGLPWVVPHPLMKRLLAIGATIVILLVALACGGAATGRWYDVLQFLHRQSFQWTDPILSYDAGWYVFSLPVITELKNLVELLTVLAGAGVGAAYFVGGAIGWPYARMTRAATIHVAVLASILLAALGLGYWLERFDLLLGSRGAVDGAGYVDVYVRMPALVGMAIASVVAALVVLWAGVTGRAKAAYGAVILLVLGHVIALWSYPSFEQSFGVKPNEPAREAPYLANNIKATRFAFGLSDVNVVPYSATGAPTLKEVEQVTGTVDNVRIWDWRVLLDTYNQIQALLPYYKFINVDTDRYDVGNRPRQVTLSVRELDPTKVDAKVRTWPNMHLFYTHGYGLVMSPVNAAKGEGLPQLWLSNMPPQSTGELKTSGMELTEPNIYFGELTYHYIFVKTKPPAVDATGAADVAAVQYSPYTGAAGVPCSSFLRRCLFAWYFSDWNTLLTESFTPETRVCWNRQIVDRARALAPFLAFDRDPYPVLLAGRIVWVLDGYTRTSRFPNSKATAYFGGGLGGANYVRNSVKVTVDAYDGSVTFYVIDPTDPLAQAAESIFPGLFTRAQMPPELQAHLRYPQDLFEVQSDQFLAYHMTKPQDFYSKKDLWRRPHHYFEKRLTDLPAYYFIMSLPDQPKPAKPEYIIMLPFTPANQDNMVGWMAGRCDGKDYGKLIVYTFPEGNLVYGPNQVEARIDQVTEISQQLTLWDTGGSSVVRGNLLVIPVGGSILYVEPLYLKSQTGAIPELKRVIVAYQEKIAMRDTLAEALAAVFESGAATSSTATGPEVKPPAASRTGTAQPSRPPVSATAARASELLEKANKELSERDFAAYGATMKELTAVIEELRAREAEKK